MRFTVQPNWPDPERRSEDQTSSLGRDEYNNKDLTITGIEPVTVGGHRCVQAHFDKFWRSAATTTKKAAQGHTIGTFTADPMLGWAIRSYEYNTSSTPKTTVAVQVEYQTAEGSLPLPRAIDHVTNGSNHRHFEVQTIERTAPPESAFTLTSYGLPEYDRPIGDVTGNALAAWLAGGACVLLGISAVIWFRSRPRRGGTAP